MADGRETTVADSPAKTARSRFATLASVYYLLATPGFMVLDYVVGANIRVAFLDGHPGLRAWYYAIALACGAVVLARPRLAPVVGVTESAANIGFLIIGVFGLSRHARRRRRPRRHRQPVHAARDREPRDLGDVGVRELHQCRQADATRLLMRASPSVSTSPFVAITRE